MTDASAVVEPARRRSVRPYERLWRRELTYYPTDGSRYAYLGIVVLISIVLYYLYYVEGAVTPLLLPGYHMSFRYFLYLLVVSNAIGAFTAFIGGFSDRIGRANLTIIGTFVVGFIQLVGVPHIHTKFGFAVAYSVIGFVEGIILVSTPALIRDFSPQMGRAAAMGFWALGPVLGSLSASVVANHTLPHLPPWQDQFVISGVVCMVVVAIALVFLRELEPQLRDQLMVTESERALVEARARGIDVQEATRHPLRSMLRIDLFSSALGIALFLLIYYASVSVLTIYWVVVFNRTTSQANGINTWYWVADAVTLVVIGIVSDRLRVRKPFMVLGAVGTIVMTILFVVQAGHPRSSYGENVLACVVLGITIGIAYTPWMAAYTELVEAHNPALTATGLAVWGWILRIVVALSFIGLPLVITTATTLVDNQTAGSELQALQAAQPYVPALTGKSTTPVAPASVLAQLNATKKSGPETVAMILQRYPQTDPALPNASRLLKVIGTLPSKNAAIATALPSFATALVAVQHGQSPNPADVATVDKASPDDLGPLIPIAEKVVPAQHRSPNQWKRWWWVCAAGQLVFLLLVFLIKGRWSPKAARADFEEHERLIARELAALKEETAGTAAGVQT